MAWQVTGGKNVAPFIWKAFGDIAPSPTIPSCWNPFASKWKPTSIIVPPSSPLKRRSIYWERKSGASQQTMKPSPFGLDERDCIGESASSFPRKSVNGNRSQPRKTASNTEDKAPQVASLPSFLDRIRRLDTPCDRLASSLFLNAPLRSAQGRSALQDMITSCVENRRVAYRPGLRPEETVCPATQCAREMDRVVYASFSSSPNPR